MIFILLKLFFIFSLLLSCISFFIFFKKYNNVKNDLNKVLLAIKRLRYGDINVRIEKLNNKELEAAANRLFETMYDREMMIKEYQGTLANKNLSLEEILKQEKQLRLFKEEFAATLTHDMKVPVIAELNSLNYLIEGRFGSLNQKQMEVLNLMKDSNQELKDLIENMLEIYRLEQKSLNIKLEKKELNPFLETILKEMEPIILKNSHKLILNLDETINANCTYDEFQLKRVIKNLIQNAVLYSPESSDIIITSKNQTDKINIYITNKGQSLTEEDLNLIFQKYYTGLSKFRKSGTGLGLYLSKQIMTAHNGNIKADCSKKGYTTFILTIPE